MSSGLGPGTERSLRTSQQADLPSVLVVDDEVDVLVSMRELLRRDYRVLTCDNGKDAIALLESGEPIQVVISDQRMPGTSGVEVLARARAVQPKATRLLITAYADIRAIIDAINEGRIYRYLEKPWDPEEFLAVVRQAVAHHELLAERDRLLTELQETNRKLIEANRLKSAFMEVASHELNTPVAVVLGLAQVWRLTHAEFASEPERHWMERIQNAGRRLAGTVDRMLELIRAEAFDQPLSLESTPVEWLAREAAEGVLPFAAIRNQGVSVEIEDEVGYAIIDRAKIGDALTNLLINAIKFTPDGGSIRLSVSSDEKDWLRFEVSDTGVGIPPEAQSHLFEPFFTGFDTRHHSSGEFEFNKRGIGLGLALVRRFVELHGGNVAVRSIPGSGSTFAFAIPRTIPAAG